MIIIRAPLRISFVGGGTDLPDFYRRHPGRVISATIDKFIYVAINSTPVFNKFSVKYQKTEIVSHPRELQHPSIRAALLDLGFDKGGVEIGSFADIPARTGLGSSSSFAVALLKGLRAYRGEKISKEAAAEAACRLEIELLQEPIGKQDQYAAAFGGFNMFTFNTDGTVDLEPIFLDFQTRFRLEKHLLLFFTGISRAASEILSEQVKKLDERFQVYKEMAESVPVFRKNLVEGDLRVMASMLHEGWLLKKSLSSNISNSLIDEFYEMGRSAGAWGGKVLGAGGGGCILFFAPPEKHEDIKLAMSETAAKNRLNEFRFIPFTFVQSGTDILFNNHYHANLV